MKSETHMSTNEYDKDAHAAPPSIHRVSTRRMAGWAEVNVNPSSASKHRQ